MTAEKAEGMASAMNHRWVRVLYSGVFFLLIALVAVLLGFASLAITRRLLREIVESAGPLTVLLILGMNFILLVIVTTFFLTVLSVYLFVPGWILISDMFMLSMRWIWVGVISSFALGAFSWMFAPLYLKVIAVLGLVPSILLWLLSLIAWILSKLKPLRAGLLIYLRRSIEHEKAFGDIHCPCGHRYNHRGRRVSLEMIGLIQRPD